jgi:hypothetical protein
MAAHPHSPANDSTDPNTIAVELQRPYLIRDRDGVTVVDMSRFASVNPAAFRRWVGACRILRRLKRKREQQ